MYEPIGRVVPRWPPAGWNEVVDDEYPRLLVDRDVAVIRDGRAEQARLRGWLDGHDGPMPSYRIELVTRLGNYTCPYTATGPDMFEALVRLRRQLEPDGLMVAVQGSRRDTYPSGMARDMGGGMQVYIMRPGRRARGKTWWPRLTTRHPASLRRSASSGLSPKHGRLMPGSSNQPASSGPGPSGGQYNGPSLPPAREGRPHYGTRRPARSPALTCADPGRLPSRRGRAEQVWFYPIRLMNWFKSK